MQRLKAKFKFNKILTNRRFMHMSSWQIVYEWEDEISNALGLQLKNALVYKVAFDNAITRFFLSNRFLSKIISKTDTLMSKSEKCLAFDLFPRPEFSYLTSVNVVPIIIDFWRNTDLVKFSKNYHNCPFVCISSLEALRFLEAQNLSLKLYHLPLSIPDKYKQDFREVLNNKKYDIILAGRENPVLQSFLNKFSKENPGLNIVYRKIEKGNINFYSTINGFLGAFNT
jgi:hypothetical protein